MTLWLTFNPTRNYTLIMDFLLYGNKEMYQLTYDSEFSLFYQLRPDLTLDNGTNGDDGSWVVKPKSTSDGAVMGRGSADPEIMYDASRKLKAVGDGLAAFHTDVMAVNATAVDKNWEGPAHTAVKSVLSGFDRWVQGVLNVVTPAAGYVGSTFDMANYLKYAQQQHNGITNSFRDVWQREVVRQFEVAKTESVKQPYRRSDWEFQERLFDKDIKNPMQVAHTKWVNDTILGPAKKAYDENIEDLTQKYFNLVDKFQAVPPKPYFEPAPTPPVPDPPKSDPLPDFSHLLDPFANKFNPPAGGGVPDPGGIKSPAGLGGTAGLGLPSGGGAPSGGTPLDGGAGLGSLPGSGGPGGGLPAGGPNPITGPNGTGFDLTNDGIPDLGLNGRPLPGSGLPAGSRMVTRPDGSKGVDLNGDGIADVGLDGKALPGGMLPAGTRLVSGPNGTGLDVTGDGIPDVGLDGQALPGGALPAGSHVVTLPDGTQGIDLNGDGVPDMGFDGHALPGGSLPDGARLVTGPDGTTGLDVTSDGIPDFDMNGEPLPGSSLFNHPGAPDLSGQVLQPGAGLAAGSGNQFPGVPVTAGATTAAVTPSVGPSTVGAVNGAGVGYPPMYPPMGGMGGMGGGQNQKDERERQTWLLEDNSVWKDTGSEPVSLLGRPVDDEEPEIDEWEVPAKVPARARGPRPVQRPTGGGWAPGRANG